jgi:hypothetical protein
MHHLTKLSELTPPVVDAIYNIAGATPPSGEPTFLFLVGAPGSGKSSGHAHAIEAGLLPAGNYATVNMDSLLESLLPFRAASSMAHYMKRNPPTADLVHFASIGAYGTTKENLGLFKWYDKAHTALEAADPTTVTAFNRVRTRFLPLLARKAPATLMEINEAALERAIHRGIPIVYETTLSLTKAGRVNKVDALMRLLKKTPYRVVFYHITGSAEDIGARIRARQEHGTTQESFPFYRYLPTSPEKVAEYIKSSKEAFDAVREQYQDVATFEEFENPMDPARLPADARRSASSRRRRIVRAYGTRRRTSSKSLGSSNRISRSASSSFFRLSSSRKKSTVRDE